MQPYFFPYIGYFSLIHQVDRFILLDEVQFIRHGWIERNRIINPQGTFTYLQVPLIKSDGRNTIIRQLTIRNNEAWKKKIISQLEIYKKRAPHYYSVMRLMQDILQFESDSIVDFNRHCLQQVCEYLEIKTEIQVFSELQLNIEEPKTPGEWALNICKCIPEIKEYWNPIGGRDIFNPVQYAEANLKLLFFSMDPFEYDQSGLAFQPNLSIVDAMMFCSKSELIDNLGQYSLMEPTA